MIEPAQLEGRKILVGITRYNENGVHTHEQFCGIASISDQESYALVRVECDNGEVKELPFDSRAIEVAPPGDYRLKGTGETVTNPDFLMTWTVTKE